jgi:iron complex outermembrane receptor protein
VLRKKSFNLNLRRKIHMQLGKGLISLFIATAFLATFLSGSSNLLQAQDEFLLEEITVTAEKRESDIQKTPLPISALTEDTLVRQNVNQMFELEKIVPDMNIQFGASSLTVVTIRGVAAGDWCPTCESPNVVHLDGVVLSRMNALENQFFDIERVEVLKGPQGTLYGRGASAGTINIITRKPELGSFGGHAEVEFGNFDMMRVEGAINLPISETWAMRAALRSIKRDGYYEDTNINNWEAQSMRLSALWKPDDRSSLLLTTDFSTYNVAPATFWSGRQFLGTAGNMTAIHPADNPWEIRQWYEGLIDGTYNRADNWGIMAQYDYELDFATATLQYGHRSLNEDQVIDFELSMFNPIAFDADGNVESGTFTINPFPFPPVLSSIATAYSDSVEARLASNTSAAAGDSLEWIVGLYAFKESIYQHASGAFVNYLVDKLEAKSYAAFGQATWTPFERLHLTGGIRRTSDEKVQGFDNTGPIYGDVKDFIHGEWDKTTYKANISYDIADESMIYGQFSTGFKAGQTTTDGMVADPEILNAYEFGSKNRFFDDRLQVNLEFYYYDYKNYQDFAEAYLCQVNDGSGGCVDVTGDGIINEADCYEENTTIAPGGAKQKGASINLLWLITSKDRVSANISYQNNKYQTYNPGEALLSRYPLAQFVDTVEDDETGREFGPAPWRGNVSYTHIFNIGETGTLEVTGDLFYEGEGLEQIMRMNLPDEYAMPGREAYWLGDISARYSSSYGMPSGMLWHVRAWVNNVWDSTDFASSTFSDEWAGGAFYFGAPGTGYYSGNYVLPRTLGIAVGANW